MYYMLLYVVTVDIIIDDDDDDRHPHHHHHPHPHPHPGDDDGGGSQGQGLCSFLPHCFDVGQVTGSILKLLPSIWTTKDTYFSA
jgi:hypothetical protein